jgi:hypothetical protein
MTATPLLRQKMLSCDCAQSSLTLARRHQCSVGTLCSLLIILTTMTTTISSYTSVSIVRISQSRQHRLKEQKVTPTSISSLSPLSMSTPPNTPTGSGNENNNIIEDDEDTKIFAALSSAASLPVQQQQPTEVLSTSDNSYTGKVDWDAEWKDLVKKGKQQGSSFIPMPNSKPNRPGQDYYKSEAEIAAIVRRNQRKG